MGQIQMVEHLQLFKPFEVLSKFVNEEKLNTRIECFRNKKKDNKRDC